MAASNLAHLGVHKILEQFVGQCLERKFLLDPAVKEIEARKLRSLIEDHSRHLPSQSAFTELMNHLTDSGYELLAHPEAVYKLAGISVLDCLLDINEDLVPDRRIQIAGKLRNVFENDKLGIGESGILILRICAHAIGHLARIASTSEIEYLQDFYYPTAMRLVDTKYQKSSTSIISTSTAASSSSDFFKLSGCLILKQLAKNSHAIIYSKRKLVFASLWEVVCDKSAVVRDASASCLLACFILVSQREKMEDWVDKALNQVQSGFESNQAEKIIGSLLILDIVIGGQLVPVRDIRCQSIDLSMSIFRGMLFYTAVVIFHTRKP